ncbi:hypothetical protein KUTeg_002131 [Tegillarca granosa]|uniref:Globin domain-containing protein n=1 Tax=Tegillarca granosa TaxID=220873 RepID=A0ABQ9FTG6_TEGGR|nr:hypothetical protein KUTeg_002131 [Tegillarca granosa]
MPIFIKTLKINWRRFYSLQKQFYRIYIIHSIWFHSFYIDNIINSMGNIKSLNGKKKSKEDKKDKQNDIENGNIPEPLTEEQKQLLQDAWISLKNDMAKIGVVTFIRLFETHPEVQDAFLPFQQLTKSDLEQSVILRSHALRVMGTVDKCLSRAHKPEKLQELMLELGSRHSTYNAKADFFEMVGQQFLHAIQPHLGDRWTPEMEQAWTQLFKLITTYMRNGMLSAGR